MPIRGARRWWVGSAWAISVLLAAGAGWWAAGTVGTPPPEPEAAPEWSGYEVATGEVGYSQSFFAQAAWRVAALGRAPVGGTVTSVDLPADGLLEPGTVVVGLDLRPMVVMEGGTPAFRDLSPGARGADVEQLRAHLVDAGYLSTVSQVYDAATARAVRAWQRDLGFPEDGVVRAGDVLFLEGLPVRAVPAEGLEPGVAVSPGDELITIVDGHAPEFTVPLTGEQLWLVPQAGDVEVTYLGHTWPGEIAGSFPQQDGSVLLTLSGLGGAPLCGTDCDVFPIPGPVNVPVEIVVTPTTTGPVVPVSAISTTPGGAPVVTTVDGRQLEIVVVASARGFAVVDGIGEGVVVRVPGTGA